MSIASSSGSSAGGRLEDGSPASAGAGWTLSLAVLVAAAIPCLYVLMAYGALRLALDWFPSHDWRHDTDPPWVLHVAICAPLVLGALVARVIAERVTAGLKGRHWALAASLAALLLVVFWEHWVREGARDVAQTALAFAVFFAFIGPGLWLGGWCHRALRRRRARRAVPLPPATLAYPRLAELMGAWFHQDYDIEGETVAEIVTAFRAATPPDDRAALRAEIAAFIAAHSQDLDRAFESTFRPSVVAAAFSGSTRAFLMDIDAQLEA